MEIATGLFFGLGALVLWALVANQLTFRQRTGMLPAVGDPEFWEKMRVIDQVSYERHFWAVFFLRRPRLLYRREVV